MILLWSPHSTGPAAQVIGYLMDTDIMQRHGFEPRLLRRRPAPELLHGDPDLVARMIDGLETRHRYSCATLSYASGDIDLEAWSGHDPTLRQQIDAALALWREVAFAGIAPSARPPMLAGTHRHAGRLELNILVPRAVWRDVGDRHVPRSYNPNPPAGPARATWEAYQDTLNMTFGWADPDDPRRAPAITGPSWVLKRAAAAERETAERLTCAEELSDKLVRSRRGEPPQVQLLMAARECSRIGMETRQQILDSLAPLLTRLCWRVDHLRSDAIVLRSQDASDSHPLILRGTLCQVRPSLPSPDRIAARRAFLARAPIRLTEALETRMADNQHVLGNSVAMRRDTPDPIALLHDPHPIPDTLARRLARLTQRLSARVARAVQLQAVRQAFARWACAENGGFAVVRTQFEALSRRQNTAPEKPANPEPRTEAPTP